MMNRVLLVEDSEEFQLLVTRALTNAGIELEIASTFKDLVYLLSKSSPQFDLAILDLNLPDSDGFKVLEKLRASGMSEDTPVFFLTSQTELNSKVTAFNLGADDYLVKPISPIELRARVEMRLRKSNATLSDIITKGELTIEMTVLRASHQTKDKKIDLSLTAKEFKILSFLIQNENKVFTRAQVVEAVWGKDIHILDRTVDSHIYGLRKKMGKLSNYVQCIQNVGYSFKIAHVEEVAS